MARDHPLPVDLRHVEYFLAVIDHGGVTRAAEALYVAQPALSQAIRHLERQLGVELFDRTGRGFMPTRAGRSFVGPARRMLRDMARVESAARDVRDLRQGRLDIAALASLAVVPLAALAGEFHRRHPGIVLNVTDPGGSADLVTEIRRGRAELGLTDLPLATGTLLTHELGAQEIALAMPPEVAAGLLDPVPLAAVSEIPLVRLTEEPGNRTLLKEELRGIGLNIAAEATHRQAVWQLVVHGVGATFLPRVLAESELDRVVVRSTDPPVHRRVGLIYRPGPLSPAAAALLHLATQDQQIGGRNL
ncbi:MAG: LysR family transcriptional regulator [Streptosporangiales bacterium]|nr:LysR family transcriptional regulator [Streptosporangiales bacterium]